MINVIDSVIAILLVLLLFTLLAAIMVWCILAVVKFIIDMWREIKERET